MRTVTFKMELELTSLGKVSSSFGMRQMLLKWPTVRVRDVIFRKGLKQKKISLKKNVLTHC
jgi:hypothetical protein